MTKTLEDYVTTPPQIAVLDFGGQYANLIKKRIDSLGVRAARIPPDTSLDDLLRMRLKGIVLSGGPRNVSEAEEQGFDKRILSLNVPILGICYGLHLIAHYNGGEVRKLETREDGPATINVIDPRCLCQGLPQQQIVWMSHGDSVTTLPPGCKPASISDNKIISSFYDEQRNIFALQYHPEVNDTEHGMAMFQNFVFGVCHCEQNYTLEGRWELSKQYLRDIVGDQKLFILASGGVDSTFAAFLALKSLKPEQVYASHIDNGFMRHNESRQVEQSFHEFGFLPGHFIMVDAGQRFYKAHGYRKDGVLIETHPLDEVLEPEVKRKIIGDTFIEVAEDTMNDLGLDMTNCYLCQGSLFTDLIESGSSVASHGGAETIKTHHNDTALARKWRAAGRMVEPNALYYKDDVRQLGEMQGLPPDMVWRHPFPGPGLAIRIICQQEPYMDQEYSPVSAQLADTVGILSQHQLNAYLVPIRTVGVQGDQRTYSYLALLAGDPNWELISSVSAQVPKVQGLKGHVNRVAYLLPPQQTNEDHVKTIVPTRLSLECIGTVREVHRVGEWLLQEYGLQRKIAQIPFPLFPSDIGGRAEWSVAIRSLLTSDWMTGQAAMPPKIPQEFFYHAMREFLKIPGVGAVVVDTSSKPPATTCWE
jgi:GMP synthase (glutamine-hydrolysing)